MSKGNLKTAKMEKLIYYQLIETRNMRKITNSASKMFCPTLDGDEKNVFVSLLTRGAAVPTVPLVDISAINETTTGSDLLIIE